MISFGLGGGGLVSGVRCDDGAPLYASFGHATVDLLDLIEPEPLMWGVMRPRGAERLHLDQLRSGASVCHHERGLERRGTVAEGKKTSSGTSPLGCRQPKQQEHTQSTRVAPGDRRDTPLPTVLNWIKEIAGTRCEQAAGGNPLLRRHLSICAGKSAGRLPLSSDDLANRQHIGLFAAVGLREVQLGSHSLLKSSGLQLASTVTLVKFALASSGNIRALPPCREWL